MKWEYLLKNLGTWSGSFTELSPVGEILKDTPSVVSLEGLNENKTIRQVVRRQGHDELVLEYSSLSRSVLFFENGAFSQGTIQLAPFSESGAEFGLIHQNHRLRLVQMFNKNGDLNGFTLIREFLAETEPSKRPTLTVNDLLGRWEGEAVTLYPDIRPKNVCSTKMVLEIDDSGRLVHHTSFDGHMMTSSASINNSVISFDQNPQKQYQVLLLPNGASAVCPAKLQLRQLVYLELGWLIQPNLRQRIIRSYSDKGEWNSLTLVTEHKI
jgi:hypothetical protein